MASFRMNRRTKHRRRRRQMMMAPSCHLLVATAALSCLMSALVINSNPRRRMVAESLIISPVAISSSSSSSSTTSFIRPAALYHNRRCIGSPCHEYDMHSSGSRNSNNGPSGLSLGIINNRSKAKNSVALSSSRLDNPSTASTDAQSTTSDIDDEINNNKKNVGASTMNGRASSMQHGSRNKSNNNNNNNNGNKWNNHHDNTSGESWLDRTTARLLDPPSSNNQHIPPGQLTADDVSLITTLMTSHARRSTVESALVCERLLKRVVDEVNYANGINHGNHDDGDGNDYGEMDPEVRVTTKMYTVAMDAWAKSQRRPLPGSGNPSNSNNSNNSKDGGGKGKQYRNNNNNNNSGGRDGGKFGFEGKQSNNYQQRQSANNSNNNNNNNNNGPYERQNRPRTTSQTQLQLHPQQHPTNRHVRQLPLGTAAQRAHRIHNSLVQTFKATGDVHLAPSTISYNAAINAWSKSYHPSSGEMAELLLGEMMREWRFGRSVVVEGITEREGDDGAADGGATEATTSENGNCGDEDGDGEAPRRVGNERVKPDVVTFTAVIDAWVKCTALAHDYHYEKPPANTTDVDDGTSTTTTSSGSHHKKKNDFKSNKSKNNNNNNNNNEFHSKKDKENYIEWKRSQAARADELTQRAAERAKELLGLMITLGHYDPERHDVDNGDVAAGNNGDNATSSSSVASSSSGGRDNALRVPLPLNKCEPGMRPNCYTYSAVMNALAKSCSALRVVSDGGTTANAGGTSGSGVGHGNNPRSFGRNYKKNQRRRRKRNDARQYDPAREAQDMLESMIARHERYKERVGESGVWSSNGAAVGYGGYDGSGTSRTKYDDDGNVESDWMMSSSSKVDDDDDDDDDDGGQKLEAWMEGSWTDGDGTSSLPENDDAEEESSDPHWFQPRPDELTFPPNTINYNSVLNAWSRASRYDPRAAMRAQRILLERMERSPKEGGDAVEPDALSYSLVIHAWLRGCRGNGGDGAGGGRAKAMASSGRARYQDRRRQQQQRPSEEGGDYTDRDRIERAMEIIDALESWARRTHSSKRWRDDDDDDDDDDDEEDEDDDEVIPNSDDADIPLNGVQNPYSRRSSFRQHDKARDLDVEVYNSILVAYSREQSGDNAADVMRLLDRMERLAEELDMPSVRPNKRSYNVALGVISNSASRADTSLAVYYDGEDIAEDELRYGGSESNATKAGTKPKGGKRNNNNNKYNNNKYNKKNNQKFNPLYAGRAAESVLSRMLANSHRPDSYAFASVLNSYQRIPNGRLDAALAADAVVRGMESLHLHGKIDEPPDVFHYTMVCACWSRSGHGAVAGERCSEILSHMTERAQGGFERVKPNIRTFNAVIDSHAYNGRVAEAEDMLLSMVDNYESSAARSMDGIEDDQLPVRPDSFSFNTVIQQWARARTPEGGRRAERILDRMLEFHHNGNADVRPDERSFAYIIYHFTKGAGRMAPDAPDRALKLLRRMIRMFRQGYKELLPAYDNRTNPIFAFTSVIDAHSVLRRPDAGMVGDELLDAMTKLGDSVDALKPNTYACLSVLYGWSSCGSVDAGERATELLRKMEKVPTKVLDAPALQDDFYLNLVDWSSQNVLAVGLGSCVYLWSAATSRVTQLCDLSPTEDAVTSVAWSEGGRHLAIGSTRGDVQLWDASAQRLLRTMTGHSARVGALSWKLAGGGGTCGSAPGHSSLLASGSRDRLIHLRDPRSDSAYEMRLCGHKQEVCGLRWSFDERSMLASGGNDNKLLVWDVKKHARPFHTFADHTAAVKAIAWSPHQHGLLASGGGTADRCIRFWNCLTGHGINCIDTGSQVCNLAFSKNCNELVSTHGYSLNQIVVWKYPSMQKIATLTGHTYRVLYLALSPDGSTIVTGAGDETLRFWQVFPGPQKENKAGGLLFPAGMPGSVIR